MRRRPKINTYLDIAPLIDCVFLLLIFFLLTSSFIQKNVFQIDLPKASFSSTLSGENITIYVTPEEDIFFAGKKVSLPGLKSIFSGEKKPLVIKADKSVHLEIVTQIIDVAKACGIGKLSIAATYGSAENE
jgi:biopolymer transport protein ExbD